MTDQFGHPLEVHRLPAYHGRDGGARRETLFICRTCSLVGEVVAADATLPDGVSIITVLVTRGIS